MISIAGVEELNLQPIAAMPDPRQPSGLCVVSLLANGKDLSTRAIAKTIGRSVPCTSNVLGAFEACRGGPL
jgi:hypothetical protein